MPLLGEHPQFFFIGAEKPGKAISPARAGVWRDREGKVSEGLGKEEKM